MTTKIKSSTGTIDTFRCNPTSRCDLTLFVQLRFDPLYHLGVGKVAVATKNGQGLVPAWLRSMRVRFKTASI